MVFERTGITKCVQTTENSKLYNTVALSASLYGNENWTITPKDARRITAAVMKYMRKTAGYSWTDYNRNTEIAR
jgi:hypothetical protein